MSTDAKGPDEVKGARIRFGIRWDDGRRPKRSLLSLALVTALLAGGAAAHAKPMPAAPAPVDVVVVAAPSRVDAAQRLTERLGGTVGRRLAIVDGFTASVPRRALDRLEASRSIRSISRDATMHVSSSGSDAATASAQMIRTATGSGSASASAFDGAGIDVAVLDSGVVGLGNLSRPGSLVIGPDFSLESRDRELAGLDTFGHGTHVAGVIAGRDPLTGYEGVAPGARIVSVKVAGADGATSLSQVLLGFDWIYRNRSDNGLRIRVLNVSLGVSEPEGYRRAPLAWAAERLWESGIAVVAAAGNNGVSAGSLDLPAADPYVIAVGATDTNGTADPADDRVAEYSSRSSVRPPDVVAPGSGIVSLRVPGSTLDQEFPEARIGEDYFRGSGTSQAAAVVSGLAARLIGQRPWLSPDRVKRILKRGAVDLPDPVSADGAGRVDIGRSAALETPSERESEQRWEPAGLDLSRYFSLFRDVRDRDRDNDYDHDDEYDHDDDDEDDRHDRGERGERDRDEDGDRDDRRRDRDHRDHEEDDETEDEDGVDEVEAGNTEWAGRRWSGRRWSGMKWSGRRWSGMKWSGMKWSGAEWIDAG